MPTYEYACADCGDHFDALRSMKDSDSPIECKQCHSMNTKRQLTVCNVNRGSTSSSVATHQSGCGGCQGGTCASCGH